MQQSQLHVPRLTYVNKIIIIISGSLFLLGAILGKASGVSLPLFLGLSAGKFFDGHIYQILTYPFVGNGLFEVLFNCLLLWLVGSELEETWGAKRYAKFLLSAVLGASFLFLLLATLFYSGSTSYFLPLTGLMGVTNFLLLAYAIIYPQRLFTFMFIFPMKAWIFCILIICIQLFYGIFSPSGILSLGHLGALVSGYIYMVLVSTDRFKNYFSSKKRERKVSKSHLKLVKTDDEDDDDENPPPKYWQ